MVSSSSSLLLLVASLLSAVALLLVPAAAQPYIPYPPALSAASCPSGATLVSYMTPSTSAFTYQTAATYTLYTSDIWLQNFNVTQFGVTMYQLQLGLLDNSNLANAAHLRLGLYLVEGTTYTLVGQTPEITVFPSGPQVVVGNLQTPVPLQAGAMYAVGSWTDSILYTASGSVYSNFQYVYYYNYQPFGLLGSIPTCSGCTYQTRPLAAAGCQSTATDPFSASGTTVYSFCAWTMTWSPPKTPMVYYSDPGPYTVYTTFQGILAATTATSTSSFGTYATVTAALGEWMQVENGVYYYGSTTSAAVLGGPAAFQLGGSTLNSANNQLYLSGAAFSVDTAGISLLTATGVQIILQYNATSGQMQTVDTVNGLTVSTTSGFNLVPFVAGGGSPACAGPVQGPKGNTPLTCPSGSSQVTYGDTSSKDLYYYYNNEAYAYLYGNVLYTRNFTVATSGTTISQLSLLTNQNVGRILHLRMSIWVAVSITNLPTYSSAATMTLLAQTAEYTLINGGDGVITLNLLSPVTLNASTTYYIGFWADSWIWAAYTYYYEFPAYWSPYTSTLPTTWTSGGSVGYDVPQAAATGCVANTVTITYTFCATFIYTTTITQYTGTLNVIPAPQLSGTYLILSGNGNVTSTLLSTGALSYNYSWVVEAFGIPYDNLITPAGSPVVDTTGISLLFANPAQSALTQTVISANAVTGLYQETQSYYYGGFSFLTNRGAAVAFSAGSTPPTCGVSASAIPSNVVSPAQSPKVSCAFVTSFGDSATLDYATRREGSFINGNTLYSVPFTVPAGITLTQMSLSILSNGAQSNLIRMGLYDPSGNLLSNTPEITLQGAVDQTLTYNLSTAVTTAAGTYRMALWSNTTLYIAYGTSSTSAAAATYSSASMPTTFTPNAAGPTIPISINGCATPTHTFCSYFQYYFPGTTPYAYTSIYSGQLIVGAPTTTSFGTGYAVQTASGHLQSVTGGYAGNSNPNAYTSLTLPPGITSYVYPTSATAAVDSHGLTFVAGGKILTISYNPATGQVQENSTVATVIFSNVTIAAYNPLAGVPACSLFSLPHKSTANAAIAPCPAGFSSVTYGDDKEADLIDNTEGLYEAVADYIFLRPFTTINTTTVIYELAFGINQNINTIVKMSLALYDGNNNFLVSTNEIQIWNPVDQVVVGQLTQPWTLLPNTIYNIAMWTDSSIFCGFTPGGSPAEFVQYNSSTWPAVFVSSQTNSVRAVQAFGCTGAAASKAGASSSSGAPTPTLSSPFPALSSSSSGVVAMMSTGSLSNTCPIVTTSSSSSGSSLSNGQIAGIVIGCSVGMFILGMLLIYCCIVGGVVASTAGKDKFGQHQDEVSKIGNPTNVEMSQVKAETEA